MNWWRRLAVSGWPPALALACVTLLLLRARADIGGRDVVAVGLWVLWAHTLPGLVAWRALDRRRDVPAPGHDPRRSGRPLLEDLSFGTALGVVLCLPVYLLLTAAGAPRLVLAWPLLVLLPALALPRGRRLLLVRQARPAPLWWSWSVAVVVAYAVLATSLIAWGTQPLTPESLSRAYVDEPYHLSLVGEFRHHVPAQVPFVAGTPLDYHWLVYPFLAAAAWGTGVDPVAIVRHLGPAVLLGVMLLGTLSAAVRLSGRRWAALPAGLLLVVGPLDVLGWTPAAAPWIGPGWMPVHSPTQFLANSLAPLLVVVLVGLLRGSARRPVHWVLALVLMLAVAGAKSAMLPLFLAGLLGTTVIMWAVHRRPPWVCAGLALAAGGVFALASWLFYGSGSRATTLDPLQIIDVYARSYGLIDPTATASAPVRAVLLAGFFLVVSVPVAGAAGWLAHGGWRRSPPWVLLGAWGAGVTAFLVLAHPSLSQAYFYRSAVVPAALLGAVGWVRAAGVMTRRRALGVAAAVALGLGLAHLVAAVTPSRGATTTAVPDLLVAFVLPTVLALALVAAVVAAYVLVVRRRTTPRPVLLTLSLLAGACLVTPLAQLTVAREPSRGDVRVPPEGMSAARWLRDHSQPDELVATNVHTGRLDQPQDRRAFWISAYSERRVLVEGWAYVPPESVGLPSTPATNRSGGGPFWDVERLRASDEAILTPTPDRLDRLADEYGVDWLLVDRARRADLPVLDRLAERRWGKGRFVVYRLPD